LPEEFQRPELKMIREVGYDWEDPRDAITIFEDKIAEYAGSKYAVAVDSCTDALFLCLKYYTQKIFPGEISSVVIPERTYISVPMTVVNAELDVKFEHIEWSGCYQLNNLDIFDGAARFTKGMFEGGLHCLSFQVKKRLPIGKGGMVLTDDEAAVRWLRLASFEGRDLSVSQWDVNPDVIGWNMYMTPEDAARGILLFDQLPDKNDDTGCYINYPDLSKLEIFK